MTDFERFPDDLFPFLAELSANNERAWFEANKKRYERSVRGPALDFIRAMGPRLGRISGQFLADDRKVGGSLMRVHRDTRFSADKTPYKTNVGIQFRHGVGKDVHAPGFYVHLSPDECFLGIGVWMPDNDTLGKIRKRIDEAQGAWRGVVEAPAFTERFERQGESLKRTPPGYAKDHPLADDLRRKSHIAVANFTHEAAESPGFTDFVEAHFQAAAPYVRFICESIDVAF